MITITMTDKRTGAKVAFEIDETRMVVELADLDPNNPDQEKLKHDFQKIISTTASEKLGITEKELKSLISKGDITLDLDEQTSKKYIETTEKAVKYIDKIDIAKKDIKLFRDQIRDIQTLIIQKESKQEKLTAELIADSAPKDSYKIVHELNKEIAELRDMLISATKMLETPKETVRLLTQLMDQNTHKQNIMIRMMGLVSLSGYEPEVVTPDIEPDELEEGKYDEKLSEMTTEELIDERRGATGPEEIKEIDAELAKRAPQVPELPPELIEPEPASTLQKCDFIIKVQRALSIFPIEKEFWATMDPSKPDSMDEEKILQQAAKFFETTVPILKDAEAKGIIKIIKTTEYWPTKEKLAAMEEHARQEAAGYEWVPDPPKDVPEEREIPLSAYERQKSTTQEHPVPPPKITVYTRDPKTNNLTKHKVKVPYNGIDVNFIDSLNAKPRDEMYKVPENRMAEFEKAVDKGDLSGFKDCLIGQISDIKKQITILGGSIKASDLDKVKQLIEADRARIQQKPFDLVAKSGKSVGKERS